MLTDISKSTYLLYTYICPSAFFPHHTDNSVMSAWLGDIYGCNYYATIHHYCLSLSLSLVVNFIPFSGWPLLNRSVSVVAITLKADIV